jgi:hypothetical protein
MQSEFKTPAQRARERQFRLAPGQTWFRGARVSKPAKVGRRGKR